ncbi:MAG: dTDP-4-dehydrorhamnose reductase [Pseudomonadota bacterium]|jgi:dTDP-4-dehydrorhamnose reductase
MRTLLIGADGQVGHELLSRLGANGDVLATTRSGRLPDGSPAFAALDLSDLPSLQAVVRASNANRVVNAAAYTAVDRAEEDSATCLAVNATAPGVLAQACFERDIPLVHFSTDYVFPGSGTQPLAEDSATGPVSVYGASKLQGERAIRASGARHKIFRLCWVYGSRGKNFLRTMLRLGAERDSLGVVADQFGCPTPASWIAETVARAIRERPDAVGTWHLAASGSTSWHGFADAIFDEAVARGLLPRKPVVKAIGTADYPTPARRPAYSVLDCSQLQRDFGITLPDWRAGLREVLSELS